MASLLRPGSRHQPGSRRHLRNILYISLLLGALMPVILVMGAGCGKETSVPDLSSQEKLGYVYRSASSGALMITTTAGGQGDSMLDWQGYGERFVFSNDGSYFTLVLSQNAPGVPGSEQGGELFEYLVASTDGSSARHVSGLTMLTFSPDSSRIAYVSIPPDGGDSNELGIMDLATGARKTLVRGGMLVNPVWVNDHTVFYTALNPPVFSPRNAGGIVYRLDIDSGEVTPLTASDRSFSIYNAPVSFDRPRIALTEKGPLYNIWSLDVAGGELKQVSNNTYFQFRAGYLPGTNEIVFESQKNPEDVTTSELAVMADDGSGFNLLTSNFFFDGVHSFSIDSGLIVYQLKNDKGATSIRTVNDDGSDPTLITETDSGWVGDPNFTPVEGWQAFNPLKMTVKGGAGEPQVISVSNPSNGTVEAVLRAFPGLDMELTPTGDHQADALEPEEPGTEAGAEPSTAKLEWNLRLEPGETTEINILAVPRPTVAIPTGTSLLFTLAVPGTPPRIHWQNLG